MNNKEKMKKLSKYVDELNARLRETVPVKHDHRPAQLKAYLLNELQGAQRALDKLKTI